MAPAPPRLAFVLLAVPAAAVQVTRDTFNSTLDDNAVTLLTFTAPWCGHCKKLKPEMEAATEALEAMGIGVADVDATSERLLTRQFDVKGFPEILVHRRDLGLFTKYRGGRTKDNILGYMRHRVGDACHPLEDAQRETEYMSFTKEGDEARVATRAWASPVGAAGDPYPPEASAKAASVSRDTLERAAEHVRDRIPCAVPAAASGTAQPPRFHVQLARSFGPRLVYAGEDDPKPLLRWFQQHSRPPAARLTHENARSYAGERDTAIGIALLPPPMAGHADEQTAYYENLLTEVFQRVADVPGPVVWLVYCRSDDALGKNLAEDYKVDPARPSLLLMDFTVRQHMPPGHLMEANLDVEAAVEHVLRFKRGEMAPSPYALSSLLTTAADFVEDQVLWAMDHLVEVGLWSLPALGLMFLFGIGGDKWLLAKLGLGRARSAAESARRGGAPAAAPPATGKKED